MKKDQILGIVRHVTSAAGALLIANGVLEESIVAELSGAMLSLAGVVWSIVDKRNRDK